MLLRGLHKVGVGSGMVMLILGLTSCGRKSSLLLERQARGPLNEEQAIALQQEWVLNPQTLSDDKNGLEVTVTYASPEYLVGFFRNRTVFGPYAGMNPYFSEQLVFYIRIANHTGKKVLINPDEFVILDDQSNQYQLLNPDYNTALAEAKAPVSTLTRGVIEEARPGYFGIGLPMGKLFAKPQQRFALLKMSGLQRGYIHDGVLYDGLIAFWTPHEHASHLKLLLTNIKTDFDANDVPQQVLEFSFDFGASLKGK